MGCDDEGRRAGGQQRVDVDDAHGFAAKEDDAFAAFENGVAVGRSSANFHEVLREIGNRNIEADLSV